MNNWNVGIQSEATKPFEGYMADVYLIDGQALEPTAFGRELTTGQWVPREVDFTPATMRYSDYLTVTPGGVFEGGRPAAAAFDGDTNTYARSKFSGEVLVFEPAGGIKFDNTLKVWGGPSAGTTLQYNGGSAISLNAGAWTDVVTSGGGTLSKLEINGGSIDAALSAIEIDGKTITNPFIYSADLYYDAQDPGNPASDNPVNWDSTVRYDDVNINGANYAASTMFDTTNNHPQSPANNDCIIWRPRQEITVTNKVEVLSPMALRVLSATT